jgi:hypothetical protein
MSYKVWVPPTLGKNFLRPYVIEPLTNREFFPDEFGVKRFFWILYGRPGLKKGLTVYSELCKEEGILTAYIDVPIESALHKIKMKNLVDVMEQYEQSKSTQGLCIVLDHGYRFMRSNDLQIIEMFRQLIPNIKKNVSIICCSDVPSREIPKDFEVICQMEGQHYYPCPSQEWRQEYFEQQFEHYRQFVESYSDTHHIKVDMVPNDIVTLTESSEFCTVLDIERFCSQVISAVHVMSSHGEKVLNLDLCKRFMRNDGGCYWMTKNDPQKLEQSFEQCAGVGFSECDKRTEHSITNAKLFEATSGQSINSDVVVESSKRFVFDRLGNQVDLGTDKQASYVDPVKEEEVFTKPEIPSKKKKLKIK